jgi:uncharacterized damage-inducible protein DinB
MNVDITIAQLQLQTDWFINALKDISDDESNLRSIEYANPMKWIAGHLLSCRMTVIEILTGIHPGRNYEVLFGKGTVWEESNNYPTIGYLTQAWMKTADEVSFQIKKVQNDAWQAPAPFRTSIPNDSIGGLIAYFSMHESFHIGQLSLLRKSLGKYAMHMGKITN